MDILTTGLLAGFMGTLSDKKDNSGSRIHNLEDDVITQSERYYELLDLMGKMAKEMEKQEERIQKLEELAVSSGEMIQRNNEGIVILMEAAQKGLLGGE